MVERENIEIMSSRLMKHSADFVQALDNLLKGRRYAIGERVYVIDSLTTKGIVVEEYDKVTK